MFRIAQLSKYKGQIAIFKDKVTHTRLQLQRKSLENIQANSLKRSSPARETLPLLLFTQR